MLEKYLYDKVISVTLYQKEVPQKTIRVSRPLSYGETKVKGKKLLYSSVSGDTVRRYASKMQRATIATIEFYEGSSYYTRTNNTGKKDRYVKHVANGPLYKYDTMDEMKKGLHPDGSLMQTGDRLYVIEGRKRWTVVVTGSESGFTTEQVVNERYQEQLKIECPESSLKPDMTFSVNLLPGQNCYKAVLKIRNLNIKNADIRLWDKMEIVAGYRNGSKALFSCPIFSSYIESPNPDGVTVFEGITVGAMESTMFDTRIEIRFNQSEIPLGNLIIQTAKGIMDGIKVASSIPKEWESLVIHMSPQVVYAENGLAVLNWLQSTVSTIISEHTHGKSSVHVQLLDGTLGISVINGPNKISIPTDSTVQLNMVSGATFNGTALTVEAPWNPELKPGGLFYMPPQFIQGSRLPNVLDKSLFTNEDNLYRVLTMSIVFGTVDNNNKMVILAVPAQFAGQASFYRTTEMLPEDYAALKTAELEIDEKRALSIEVGTLSGVDKAALEVAKTTTELSMFDKHKQLPGFSFMSLTIDSPVTGYCLSMISEYYCYDYANGPKLISGQKGTSKPCGRYYIPVEELKGKAASYPQNEGIPCARLWWPLIAIATYWRWKEEEASGMSNNWMHINPDNPDFIINGKALCIPVFSDYSALRAIKDVYKDAYLDYKEKYPSYSTSWRAMYYMLGGIDDCG